MDEHCESKQRIQNTYKIQYEFSLRMLCSLEGTKKVHHSLSEGLES